MGTPANEEDLFEHESVSELPSREAMSIIDPSFGPRVALDPTPIIDSTGQGIDEGDIGT